jgi:hypothetical protein
VEQLDRITQNTEVMGGKPCVRGVRVTVGMIVGQIGAGRRCPDRFSVSRTRGRLAGATIRGVESRRARSGVDQRMKLLIDMNLSPRWVKALAEAEIEASHWSSLGPVNASDADIMSFARTHGYVSSPTIWSSARSWRRRKTRSQAWCRSELRMSDLRQRASSHRGLATNGCTA